MHMKLMRDEGSEKYSVPQGGWRWTISNSGDIVVPSHRTDWGLRSFAVAGPSSWNALPVGLRSSSFV